MLRDEGVAGAEPNLNKPADRSRRAPNTLGASGRGRHNHSTDPSGATRQLCSLLDKSPYSAIGGNVLIGTHGILPSRPYVLTLMG